MDKVTDLKFYAALPGRVVSMEHITAVDFRVLGIIAFHDRMGRNGQHSWVSRSRIAYLAKCEPVSVSTSMHRLIGLGLLKLEGENHDLRRKIYSVVYKPQEDADALGIRLSEKRLQNGDLITCSIPARAVLDDGLSPLHFKVLSIISHYYRFGKNGQGCWKSREKLAAHIGCVPRRYSLAVSYLMGNGEGREGKALVGVLDKPQSDGRRRQYGSIYVLEQDSEVLRKSRRKSSDSGSPSTPTIIVQNTGNRSQDHYQSDQEKTQITSINQQEEVVDTQTEYIKQSITYTGEPINPAKHEALETKELEHIPKRYHNPEMEIAKRMEDWKLSRCGEGWNDLTALDDGDPDALQELLHLLWMGELTRHEMVRVVGTVKADKAAANG
jgi:hypothetical protein